MHKLQFRSAIMKLRFMQSPEDFQDSLMNSIDLDQLRYGASSTYSNSSNCDDECESLDWRNEGFTPEVELILGDEYISYRLSLSITT